MIQKTLALMHEESILICEEASDIQALCCNPSDPVFDKWKKAVAKQAELSKRDFTIGTRLVDLISKQQLTPLHAETAQPVMQTPRLKQQLWQGVREISALLVNSGFCSAEAVAEMIAELKLFADTSTAKIGFFRYLQLAAKKSDVIEKKPSFKL